MSGIFSDGRVIFILLVVIGVSLVSFLLWRREVKRLHTKRGYDAHDPHIEREAWANTRAGLRTFNTKSRILLSVVRGLLFAPICALVAIAFAWVALPSATDPRVHWDMLGVSALAAFGAWIFGRVLFEGWRDLRNR